MTGSLQFAVTAAELQMQVNAAMTAANAAVAAANAKAGVTTSTTPSTPTTTSTLSTTSSVAAQQAAAQQAVADAMAASQQNFQTQVQQMQSTPGIAAINSQYGGGATYDASNVAANQAYHDQLVANAMKAATGAKGDPLMQAFDGSSFFFHGKPGKIYNFVFSSNEFQVTCL